MAGKMRLSANSRRSRSSMLPVPLNSSKITSSIFEPVSISAVARMVSEPPSSMLRAAPKNRFGGYSADESTPPDRIRPLAGAAMLYARPSRVIESSRTTTSWPSSTSRLARSIASSATVVWSSAGRSNVEAMTSPLHGALHVGDLFGPLVDQHDHQVHFGVVRGDRVRDAPAAPSSYRPWAARRSGRAGPCRSGDDVDDPGGEHARARSPAGAARRVQRGQLGELLPLLGDLRVRAVDGVDPDQRVELLLALTLRGCFGPRR